jgi:hypothetical protein
VQFHDVAADGRHGHGQLADLGHRDRLADRGIGQRVPELGREPVGVLGRELLQIGIEDTGEPEQDSGRHRALTGLQLVHITGRDAQRAGQRCLRQSAFLPEPAEPDAHASLRGRHHSPSSQTLQNCRSGTTNLHTPRDYRFGGFPCIL